MSVKDLNHPKRRRRVVRAAEESAAGQTRASTKELLYGQQIGQGRDVDFVGIFWGGF